MDNKPVRTINIHDNLRSKLCDLYENDCIFDKFECTFSGDGNSMMTGSYSNNIHIYGRDDDTEVTLQADKSAFKAKKLGSAKNKATNSRTATAMGRRMRPDESEFMDYNKKILHSSWHPRENTIAVAATNNLFIFT